MRRKVTKDNSYTSTPKNVVWNMNKGTRNNIGSNRCRKSKMKSLLWIMVLFGFSYSFGYFVISSYGENGDPDDLFDNAIKRNQSLRLPRELDSNKSSVSIIGEKSTKDLNTLIKDQMKTRLKSLPSPPWPQLDHRTAEAIASGVVLGMGNCTEFNFNHTIVTAYYEFNSKHSVQEYKRWMIGLFQTSDPIIVFVEPQSKWFDVVKELRQHAPTIIAQMKFDDLVMSTTFTKEFWDYEHSIDTEAKIHKGSGVYKIWNEKLIFIYNAIHLNPFQTTGFAWIDAGYYRQIRDAPEKGTPLVRLDYTKAGVPEEKILVMHVRDDPLDAVARVNVAGNSFYGTGQAFLNFYKNYYTTFYDWIAVKNKFIGSDQFVMTETCRRYASGCYPYFAGRFKSWFALSAVIMGKKKLSEVSPKYLFLEKEPDDLSELPEGKKITFCNGHILPIDDLMDCNQ